MRPKLRIYDFDNTLVKTRANIYVRRGRKVKTLTPEQFANYTPKPMDVLDFSEFDTIIKSALPIPSNIRLLRQSINAVNTRTTILTARMLAYPVRRYIKQEFDLDVYVVAVHSANPQIKADYVEQQIKKGYTDIVVVDDSLRIVQAIEALKSKYPQVSLQVIHTTDHERVLDHDKKRLHSKGRKKDNSVPR